MSLANNRIRQHKRELSTCMISTDQIETLAQSIAQAAHIVFLTGAGMSTESGIPDFRSAGGLYSRGAGEEIFSIVRFDREPLYFYNFGRQLIRLAYNARPNPGHRAIAALEHEFGKDVTVVTQNIDTLHQQAGSRRICCVHGSIATCTCRACGTTVPGRQIWRRVERGDIPPRHAHCGGVFKPDITFFGEELPLHAFEQAQRRIALADLLVVAGTSLVVYPVASLPRMRGPDCRLAVVNKSETELDVEADVAIRDAAGETLHHALACLRNAE